jgi:hypothetical protein
MLEEGIVRLVQGSTSVAALATGGFLGALPKDLRQGWAYKFFGHIPNLTLKSSKGLVERHLQIDSMSDDRAQTLLLSGSIDDVLNGFRGVLPDSGATYVDSCFLVDVEDFDQDPNSRGFRRMTEYQIFYKKK